MCADDSTSYVNGSDEVPHVPANPCGRLFVALHSSKNGVRCRCWCRVDGVLTLLAVACGWTLNPIHRRNLQGHFLPLWLLLLIIICACRPLAPIPCNGVPCPESLLCSISLLCHNHALQKSLSILLLSPSLSLFHWLRIKPFDSICLLAVGPVNRSPESSSQLAVYETRF